jgi:hypothetical protein
MSDRPEHHYVPILKGKKGEFDALRCLDAATRGRLTPLIEVTPVPWDWDEDQPTKSLAEHLGSAADQIEKSWTDPSPIWVDTLWLAADDDVSGISNLEALFNLLRGTVQAVPVGSPGRGTLHSAAVAAVAALDGRGAVLRLDTDDLTNPGALLSLVDGWLASTSLSPESVDLVVDMGAASATQVGTLSFGLTALIPALPHLTAWRSFTLASGAFPSDSSAISPQSIGRIDRSDLQLWTHVVAQALPRIPAFSDYAIGHPSLFDADPRNIRPPAAIRYTAEALWVFVKERSVNKYKYVQFKTASAKLMNEPEWLGQAHCQGCDFIATCAAGGSVGNLTSWRRVGTAHHLTLTASQLANLA